MSLEDMCSPSDVTYFSGKSTMKCQPFHCEANNVFQRHLERSQITDVQKAVLQSHIQQQTVIWNNKGFLCFSYFVYNITLNREYEAQVKFNCCFTK